MTNVKKEEHTLDILYYLKDDPPSIYAWTLDEMYLEEFLTQRDNKLFYHKKVHFNPNFGSGFEASEFMDKHQLYKLTPDTLWDGTQYIDTILTQDEAQELGYTIDAIRVCVMDAHAVFNVPDDFIESTNEKYIQLLMEVLDEIYNYDEINVKDIRINTFKLFLDLNKKTFINRE